MKGNPQTQETGRSILMTGGTGFLGSHLLRRLVDEGHRVTLLKRSTSKLDKIRTYADRVVSYDLDRDSALEEAFQGRRFDWVIHCATQYDGDELDAALQTEANLELPLELLKYSTEHSVPCFINCDTTLFNRESGYSLSKRQFLERMESWPGRISRVNVALTTFYGPGDDSRRIIPYLFSELLSRQSRIALTKGEQLRDFIHISDVVEAFMAILRQQGEAWAENGVTHFQVGSGRKIRIRELAELIQSLVGNTGTELAFGTHPYNRGEAMDFEVDLSALQSLGWRPQWTLEDGLRDTCRFFDGAAN